MVVNYLIEINALNDWELTNPIGDTAYKVLCKLYYLANKERFPEWIRVSNGMLMSLVGCSEKSLITARNKLIQTGRIAYKGQKKLTPMYSIQYFSENNNYNCKNYSYSGGYNGSYSGGYNGSYSGGYNGSTITINNKLKENKENENPVDDIYTEYPELDALCEEIADRSGHKGNIAYIKGIRNNLIRGGEEAIRNAKDELKRMKSGNNAHNYLHHEYTDDDFDEGFYFDPFRDHLRDPSKDALQVMP